MPVPAVWPQIKEIYRYVLVPGPENLYGRYDRPVAEDVWCTVLMRLNSYNVLEKDNTVVQQALPPGGEVVLVHTDVQDSTMIWDTLPETMALALPMHDLALRLCIKQHGGYEVRTEGDSFLVCVHCGGRVRERIGHRSA